MVTLLSRNSSSSWTNFTGTTLPDLVENCLKLPFVYEDDSQDTLYVGTLNGDSHRNATMNDSQPV